METKITTESKSAEKSSIINRLFPNRDVYSWVVLVLIIVGETFVLGTLRTQNWLFWGTGAAVTVILTILLVIAGYYTHHRFSIKSVILTKLLANAISPSKLGAIYLLFFVIHIGWLTNAAMSLFTPSADLSDVLIAIAACTGGMIALIWFFPIATSPKDTQNVKKVFVSGISFITYPRDGYDKLNLIPLVRILQLMKGDEKPCRLIILLTSAIKQYDSKKKNEDEVNVSFSNQTKTFANIMGLVNPEKVKDIEGCLDAKRQIEMLIRQIARKEFPEIPNINDRLKIEFTEPCDYNTDFEGCFAILDKKVNPLDDENHQLIFNCTPGTSTIGSLMTLFAIDGDRKLYYYSQEEMPKDLDTDEKKRAYRSKLLKPVNKEKIPLYNLLSQALEKFEKQLQAK